MLWYNGQNSEDPRGTVKARVGRGTDVSYGVQGTEHGIVNLVRTLASQAVQQFSSTMPPRPRGTTP